MNLKLDLNIVPSSCYTRYKLLPPPISSVGGASVHVDRIRKSPFYTCTSLWQLTARDRRLALAFNVGSVEVSSM